jgi:hypothetical protein
MRWLKLLWGNGLKVKLNVREVWGGGGPAQHYNVQWVPDPQETLLVGAHAGQVAEEPLKKHSILIWNNKN